MKNRNYILLTLALLTLALMVPNVRAQVIYTPYAFTNFAGFPGRPGSADGTGTNAQFKGPTGMAADSAGNVYVADTGNNTIREITPAGVVTTLAGSVGVAGSADGSGTNAQFNGPWGVAVDTNGNVYVSDYNNATIRKITSAGVVTTLAGSVGVAGYADGTGTSAQFNGPQGIAVDKNGNVYVAEFVNMDIRMITPAGVVTTLAGTPTVVGGAGPGSSIPGASAGFSHPNGLAIDSAGNLYVADYWNHEIRKIAMPGAVVTVLAGDWGKAGGNVDGTDTATFSSPWGVSVDSAGNVYVADRFNNTIRRVTPSGMVTTLAGSPGVAGSADGLASTALFNGPVGVAVDSAGNVYVSTGPRITKGIPKIPPTVLSATRAYLDPTIVVVVFNGPLAAVTATNVSNYALDNGATISGASLNFNGSVVLTTSPLYNNVTHILTINNVQGANGIAIATNSQITVSMPGVTSQSIYTPYAFTNFAGIPGVAGSTNGTGSAALFRNPHGVAVDTNGNVYVADQSNDQIRKITPGGVVTTLAGTAGVAGSADGTGTNAQFYNPSGVAVDSAGNVYVADYYNHTIRRIDTNDNVTTWAGSPGQPGSADGTGGGALFHYPNSVAVDSAGNLYVADEFNFTIRKIDTNANVTTLAGSPGVAGGADGVGSAASFYYPNGIAVDSAGNVYTADILSHTIRKIDTNDNVTTLAGSKGNSGSADGIGSAALFNDPANVAVDANGNVYVSETGNDTIRKITPAGMVTTLAGSPGQAGSADGVGSAARFSAPYGLAVNSAGNVVYVGDFSNDRITKGIIASLTVVSAARDYVQPTVVSVVFSEPLIAATATNLSNYALNNGGTIAAAVVNLDGSVMLTTSPLLNNVTNILTVHNMQGINGLTMSAAQQVTVSVPSGIFRAAYTLGGTNDVAALEAEDYNLNTAIGGYQWVFTTNPPLSTAGDTNRTFSRTGAMIAEPAVTFVNLGNPALGSVPANSPRLDFTVKFTNAGNYYVWLRGLGDAPSAAATNAPNNSRSVYIGLDGVYAAALTAYPLYEGYFWGNTPIGNNLTGSSGGPYMVVTTPGYHLISVWMRQNGFTVDKLLLTSDGGFTPTGLGPAESPVSGTGPVLTITRSGTNVILSWPGGGTLQSSTNVVGTYVDIPASSSPFNVVPAGAQKYYRVRQ